MKQALLIFLLVSTAFAEGDWRQNLTPASPGKFPPLRPFRAIYSFGWGGFTAARAEAAFTRSPDNQLRMEVKGGTTGFVRVLWRLDATHLAYANASTLLPVSMRQVEIYRGQTLKTNLDFDEEGVTRLFVKQPADKPQKPVEYKFPNIRDMCSALMFVRSLRLQTGETYSLVVYPGTSPFLITAKVSGKEKIEVPAGKFTAIKVDLRLWRIGRDYQLDTPAKCKHAVAWVSDDSDRLPLKAQADVFVGSIWGELQKVTFLNQPSDAVHKAPGQD